MTLPRLPKYLPVMQLGAKVVFHRKTRQAVQLIEGTVVYLGHAFSFEESSIEKKEVPTEGWLHTDHRACVLERDYRCTFKHCWGYILYTNDRIHDIYGTERYYSPPPECFNTVTDKTFQIRMIRQILKMGQLLAAAADTIAAKNPYPDPTNIKAKAAYDDTNRWLAVARRTLRDVENDYGTIGDDDPYERWAQSRKRILATMPNMVVNPEGHADDYTLALMKERKIPAPAELLAHDDSDDTYEPPNPADFTLPTRIKKGRKRRKRHSKVQTPFAERVFGGEPD